MEPNTVPLWMLREWVHMGILKPPDLQCPVTHKPCLSPWWHDGDRCTEDKCLHPEGP